MRSFSLRCVAGFTILALTLFLSVDGCSHGAHAHHHHDDAAADEAENDAVIEQALENLNGRDLTALDIQGLLQNLTNSQIAGVIKNITSDVVVSLKNVTINKPPTAEQLKELLKNFTRSPQGVIRWVGWAHVTTAHARRLHACMRDRAHATTSAWMEAEHGPATPAISKQSQQTGHSHHPLCLPWLQVWCCQPQS